MKRPDRASRDDGLVRMWVSVGTGLSVLVALAGLVTHAAGVGAFQ